MSLGVGIGLRLRTSGGGVPPTLAAPANTTAPTISGTPTEGQTLTAGNGFWSGYPTPTFTYQWKRAGANISGATASTYLLVFADVGNAIAVQVTATNSQGSNSATSGATASVAGAPAAPVNTVAPAVTGTAAIGQTLTTTTGTWTGSPAPTYTYQWFHATTSSGTIVTFNGLMVGSAISGATSATYVLQAGDAGFPIYCEVTGTNSQGFAMKQSNATTAVISTWWQSGAALDLDFVNNRAYGPRTNLIPRSDFSDVWVTQNTVVASNAATPPIAGAAVVKIVPDSTNASHSYYYPSISGPNTWVFSAYVKAAGRNIGYLSAYDSNANEEHVISFDLTTGAFSGAFSGNASGITYGSNNAGNGWWRLWISASHTSPNLYTGIGVRQAGGNWSGDDVGNGTDGILAAAPQLEAGSVPTPYIPTSTAAVMVTDENASLSGLLSCTRASTGTAESTTGITSFATNTPRITDKGLLVEESRTNYVYPSIPASGTWTGGPSITANGAVAPDGTTTASVVSFTDGSGGNHILYRDAALSSPCSAGAWVKGTVGQQIYFHCDTSGTPFVRVLHTFSGGWERIKVENVAITGSGYLYFETHDRVGTGAVELPAVTFSVWHCDVQNGTFLTSTIPTTTASATRNAETVAFGSAGVAVFQGAEGTAFVEANVQNADASDAVHYAILAQGAALDNAIGIGRLGGSNHGFGFVKNATANQAALEDVTVPNGSTMKAAFAFKANDFGSSFNGATALTDSSGSVPGSSITEATIGAFSGVSAFIHPWNSAFRRITLFPTRKTNSELQTLTA